MKRKPQIMIGIALIALFVILAVAAPILAPNDPNATNLALKNAPPSAEYPLGCDQMGRCELSRLIYGARYSLGLSIPVLIVIAAITLFVGCYSSYKGGILDEIMRLVCDILMAFPLIVIAMSLVSAVDDSVASIIIAIGISMASWFLRMVRSYAKTECGKEYIEASKISGASNFRIVTLPFDSKCASTVYCLFYNRNCNCDYVCFQFCIFGGGFDCRHTGMGRHAG